jgi:hypothetical protein
MHIREMGFENINWISLAQACPIERFCEQGDEPSGHIPLGIIWPTDNSITRHSRNHILGRTPANKSHMCYAKFEFFMAVKIHIVVF